MSLVIDKRNFKVEGLMIASTRNFGFTVEIDGVVMNCRVMHRTGGFRSGHVCLWGLVGNEERMECDVTTTYRRYGNNPERFTAEVKASALGRLRQIYREYK